MKLSAVNVAKPTIINRRDEYDSDPFIDMAFPNGDIWRYEFQDQYLMNYYLKQRNMGRLAAKLRQDDRVKKTKLDNNNHNGGIQP